MVPEVLIVGDSVRRADLVRRIRALGYDATVGETRDLERRIRSGAAPAVVAVCISDVDPATAMTGLRRTREGAVIPVILHGPLGGAIRDLADVLDLGADHFLEEPALDADLRTALEQLAGPVMAPPVRTPPRAPMRMETSARAWPVRTEVIENDGTTRRTTTHAGTDPTIGQLHKTIDILEERFRADDRSAEHDDFDLEAMGIDAVPNVDEGSDVDPFDRDDRFVRSRAHAGEVARSENPTDTHGERGRESVRQEATVRMAGEPSGGASSSLGSGSVSTEARPRGRRPPGAAILPIGRSGSISDLEVPRLLWRLHSARFAGKLALRRGRVQKEVWLRDGAVVFARSNLNRDRFVDGLLRRGILTRPQYEAARRLAAKEPRRAGQILVGAGFLKPDELHAVLRDHLISIVDSTFAWVEGTWDVVPGERSDEPVTVETSTPALLIGGIRRRLDVMQLRARIGGIESFPVLSPAVDGILGGLRGLAEELHLTQSEEQLLAELDGRNSLALLLERGDADDLELLGVVYALDVMGLVSFSGEQAPDPGEHDPTEIDCRRILARLTAARQADYFTVLGVGRDAGRTEIRRAYDELSRTFGDAALEPKTRQRMAHELAELRVALAEAREILDDDTLRSAYLAHLEDP